MTLVLRVAAIAIACALLAGLAGCGGDAEDPEITLGGEQSRSERNQARIDELQGDLAHERREKRRRPTSERRRHARGGATLDAAAFEDFAATQAAELGVAIGAVGGGAPQLLGTVTSGPAWSTIKVPMAARAIADAGGPEQLSVDQEASIAAAITRSDNEAAARLWTGLATGYGGADGAARAVEQVLADAGDGTMSVSTVGRDGFSPYGQTEWPLAAQQRFMSGFAAGCAAPSSLDELRSLMSEVAPDQSWGLGSAGVPAYFKGGWGPDPDGRYLVRQMGVLDLGKPLAVAIAARPADGQFATGTEALTNLARWLAANGGSLGTGDTALRC